MSFKNSIQDIIEACLLNRKETHDILSEKQRMQGRIYNDFKFLCTRRWNKNLQTIYIV